MVFTETAFFKTFQKSFRKNRFFQNGGEEWKPRIHNAPLTHARQGRRTGTCARDDVT
jgi:hypothetical protein